MTEIKQGWEIKKLIDIADVSTGKYDANHANENGKYRFYTCAYNYGMCNTNRFSGKSIILPGNGVNVGEVFYYDGEFDAYQRTYVINNIKIFPKYLHYHMLLFWKELGTKLQYGSATNFIKIGNFQNYDVSFPPLPEQLRIVYILDKAFAAIATAKANAEQNLKNAKELFDNYLQSVFANKGDGWEVKTLGEIASFRNGMNFTKGSKGEVIKLVGVRDFQKSFWVPFECLESVTIDGKLNEIDLLKEGDIIAVRSNGNPALIGRTLLAGIVDGNVSHSGFTIRIRLNSKNISPLYVCHYLKTQKARKELIESGTGINIKSLNQGSLSSLQISFPKSLSEQQTIVQKLDALSAETKKLEAIYQQKVVALEELKKSVLQKAFNGEL
jgi:type I restriction enzyme, S subunit